MGWLTGWMDVWISGKDKIDVWIDSSLSIYLVYLSNSHCSEVGRGGGKKKKRKKEKKNKCKRENTLLNLEGACRE